MIDDDLISGLEKAVALVAASRFTSARPHELQKLRVLSESVLADLADSSDLLSMATVSLAAAALDWLDGDDLDGDDLDDVSALGRVMRCWEAHLEAFAATRFGIDPIDLRA